jgi:putative hydrolase of the HAD superfamily
MAAGIIRPRLVIFDMDEVLCHYDLGKRLRHLAQLADVTARDVQAAIWDSGFESASDAGGFPESEGYLAAFSRRLGHAISEDEWVAARRAAMAPNDEVLVIVRAIRQDADLALYTNNGPLVKKHFGSLFPEAAQLFPQCFCSFEFETKKPDPESYRRLLKALGQQAQDCWFIDDKKSNVEGARLAGIDSHHFRSARLLAEAAAAKGFAVNTETR